MGSRLERCWDRVDHCLRTYTGGYGIEDWFAYEAPRLVRVRDARLGALFYTSCVAISVYIYTQLMDHLHYLEFREPHGVVRFSLRQPTEGDCDPQVSPDCRDAYPPTLELPYCCKPNDTITANGSCRAFGDSWDRYACAYFDGTLSMEIFQDSILLRTATKIQLWDRNPECEVGATSCSKLYIPRPEPKKMYTAAIESFTLLIDHSLTVTSMGISMASSEMQGFLYVAASPHERQRMLQDGMCRNDAKAVTDPPSGRLTNSAPCYIPSRRPGEALDVFRIGHLLNAMGLALDDPSPPEFKASLRYKGFSVLVTVWYYNSWPWRGLYHKIAYVYMLEPQLHPYKYLRYKLGDTFKSRRDDEIKGIRITGVHGGKLGCFSLQKLLITLGTSATLLAGAMFIIKYVAFYVLAQQNYYFDVLINVTHRFSCVRKFDRLPDKALVRLLAQRNLVTSGTRVEQVKRLLQDLDQSQLRVEDVLRRVRSEAGSVELCDVGARGS